MQRSPALICFNVLISTCLFPECRSKIARNVRASEGRQVYRHFGPIRVINIILLIGEANMMQDCEATVLQATLRYSKALGKSLNREPDI